MVEEDVEIWCSEMLKIEMILLLSDNYFTMVEENFEIWLSETLQIGIIVLLFHIISPWLKKILKFDFLKRSRLRVFYYFLLFTRTE